MNSTQADFALIRRYHDAHMDSPFQRQAEECLNRLEAKLESWEVGCVCTDKSRAKVEAAERERIFGLLNNPSFVLTAAIHHDAEGKAWLGENFLACYLNPTK